MALDETRGIVFVADRFRVGRLLWRQPARRQPVCEFARRAECRDRQAALAFPVRAPRHLGSRPAFASEPGHGRRNGETIDAVAQTTKHAFVFVFDRVTGKPLFPIEYRKFPPSDVPGEVTADTQPIPTAPAPFSRQRLTREMLSKRTPEVHKWALEQFAAVPQRRPVPALCCRIADRHLSRIRRRCGVGRFRIRSGERPPLRERQRPAVDGWIGAGRAAEEWTLPVFARLRRMSP